MAIQVRRNVVRRIRQNPVRFTLEVTGASDRTALVNAVEAAAQDVRSLLGPLESEPFRSSVQVRAEARVVAIPAGAVLAVEGGQIHRDTLVTIPDLLVRQLDASGITKATVSTLDAFGDLFEGVVLEAIPRAVLLRLYLRVTPSRYGPRPRLPVAWLEAARDWAAEGLDDDEQLWAKEVSTAFHVTRGDTLPALTQSRARIVQLFNGDIWSRYRGANALMFGRRPVLALAAGGPDTTDDDIVATFGQLVDVGRGLASEAAYAFVSVEDTSILFNNDTMGTELARSTGATADMVELMCDEIALDAFPYQLLGEGHMRRLTAGGRSLVVDGLSQGAQAREEGVFELAIGDPVDWIVDRPPPPDDPYRPLAVQADRRRDPQVQARAREILGPCLLTKEEGLALWEQRPPIPP